MKDLIITIFIILYIVLAIAISDNGIDKED